MMKPEDDVLGENLRNALDACDRQTQRSFDEFSRRMEGRRPALGLAPLAASIVVCAAIFGAILFSGGPRVEPPAAPAQDKKPAPADDQGLQAQIALLEKLRDKSTDDKERELIEATIRTVRDQMGKNQKKPTSKTDDRIAKLRAELDGTYLKIKMATNPDDKAMLESRAKEIGQELKLLETGTKKEGNLKEIEMKLSQNPDDVPTLVERGRWFFDSGKPDLAIRDLDRAIALKADYAPAYLMRAMARAMAGEPDKADADLKRGYELDPSAKKEIEYASATVKKLGMSKKGQPQKLSPKDVEQQIKGLDDRLSELAEMEANAELPAQDRARAKKEADRLRQEIEKLKATLPQEKKK